MECGVFFSFTEVVESVADMGEEFFEGFDREITVASGERDAEEAFDLGFCEIGDLEEEVLCFVVGALDDL